MARGLCILSGIWACLAVLGPASSWGQKPPPPAAGNPGAPVLAAPFPLGMPRGSSLDLVLSGTNLDSPTEIWTGFPGTATIIKEDKSASGNIKVKLEIPADTPLGFYGLRVATTQGISNLKIFCIDELPNVLENDKNNSKNTAQVVKTPCVVVGKTDAEQSDWYQIAVQAGDRLSFDLLGRRLGGPIDPQLSLYSAQTGRELAHNNDSPGAQTDPRLTYTFSEGGNYWVEVRDVLGRGGADYGYRLRIGDFPLATTPMPLAAKRGSKVRVHFAGPMVEGTTPLEVQVPADPGTSVLWVAPKSTKGLSGWPVPLILTDQEEILETEPNNTPDKAQTLSLPIGVSGQFQVPDDLDYFRFAGKKGQKILIEAQTLELGSPSLVYLSVKNAKGTELAKSTPASPPPADQRIEFTVPEDGNFLLEVQHLNFAGGPSETYHLILSPSLPTFDLTVISDKAEVTPGSAAPLLVQVNRKGYAGPIDLSLVNVGNLVGSTTVPAGQTSGVLLVKVNGEQPMGILTFGILGQGKVDGQTIRSLASVKTPLSQSMAGLLYPPHDLIRNLALGIKQKGPITLVARLEHPANSPGLPAQVILTAQRTKGFEEEITLNPPTGLPPTVAAPKIPPIPKGKTEIKFNIDLSPKTPQGEFLLLFSGKSKEGKKDIAVSSEPLVFLVGAPFDLKVEPAEIKGTPGGKVKLQVTAVRKTSYKGPISLEVRKLPAGASASKASLEMGKDSAEIVITLDSKTPTESVEVDVLGTATGLNNLTGASSPVRLNVGKK